MYGGKIREEGAAEKIMNNPSHPYTQALLSSIPKFLEHHSEKRMSSIPGKVTENTIKLEGCPFASRCSYVIEQCRTDAKKCYKMEEENV